MIYLLLGNDTQAKDNKIAQIKSQVLENSESTHFDFESLDAFGLSATNLKKSFLALPLIASKRLILIRHANRLKSDVVKLLSSFTSQPNDQCDLILETSEELKTDWRELIEQSKVFRFGTKEELNIFDITKLISARKTTEALKLLHEFYDQGTYPLQMMGAIVWYWGKEGRKLGNLKFEQGLSALEEADLNIKRSRLLPEYALEKLVVELVEIQK